MSQANLKHDMPNYLLLKQSKRVLTLHIVNGTT
jgi:hypothetical protein